MKLTKSPLDPRAVSSGLKHQGANVPLLFFERLDSTMDEARRLLITGNVPPFIVVAAQMDKGRGRMGRVWYAQDLGNFYWTFVFPFLAGMERLQHLTLWFGEVLARYCQDCLGLPVYVKLPNDLYSGSKKLAGMLIETIGLPGNVISFGLGMNVNSNLETLPEELKGHVTSLEELRGKPLPYNQVAKILMEIILESYEHFTAQQDLRLLDPGLFVKNHFQARPSFFNLQ